MAAIQADLSQSVAPASRVAIRAGSDLGAGFDVWVDGVRSGLLIEGATIRRLNGEEYKTRILLDSSQCTACGDPYVLFCADIVVGRLTWTGHACKLEGVFTQLVWRTEQELSDELESRGRNTPYFPSEPFPLRYGQVAGQGSVIPATVCIMSRGGCPL